MRDFRTLKCHANSSTSVRPSTAHILPSVGERWVLLLQTRQAHRERWLMARDPPPSKQLKENECSFPFPSSRDSQSQISLRCCCLRTTTVCLVCLSLSPLYFLPTLVAIMCFLTRGQVAHKGRNTSATVQRSDNTRFCRVNKLIKLTGG